MVVVCLAGWCMGMHTMLLIDGVKKCVKDLKRCLYKFGKNEEYKEMKKENNYISTDMNHKKLIFGVVIIHVCFMLIGASGIISTLKEKNIFYGVLINMIYQLTLIIMIGVAMKQYLIASFKKFKADRISVNIKRVLAGVGIAFLLSCIAGIIERIVCSNISVPANQSNVSGYFVDYPIFAIIMSVIMGPFTEELIYRGILFRFFSKYGELCAYRVFIRDLTYEHSFCFII